MKKIFETSEDLYVSCYVIYAKTGDTKAYADVDCTKTIGAAKLYSLFIKGCVIVNGENTYKPVSVMQKNNVTTLSYVTVNAGTPAIATLVSAEPAK